MVEKYESGKRTGLEQVYKEGVNVVEAAIDVHSQLTKIISMRYMLQLLHIGP